MDETYEVIDLPESETTNEEEDGTFPWKPLMAAFVAGATSTATLVAVSKLKRRKAAKAEEVPVVVPQVVVEGNIVTTPAPTQK